MSPSISVSNDILAAGEMKLGDASKFAYDDSKLTDSDRDALSAIAVCFTTRPLIGPQVVTVCDRRWARLNAHDRPPRAPELP